MAAGVMLSVTLPLLLFLNGQVHGGKDKPIFGAEITELMEMLHEECVAQTGVADEDIRNCEAGIFKEDTKLKCYTFCILEEAGLVDDDVVDYDMMFSMMPEEYLERSQNMILSCQHLDQPGIDNCQKIFDMHKCSYAKDPDFYYIF